MPILLRKGCVENFKPPFMLAIFGLLKQNLSNIDIILPFSYTYIKLGTTTILFLLSFL